MEEKLDINQVKLRWEKALKATDMAVSRHPDLYRELKSLVRKTMAQPLDINDYFPMAEKLDRLINSLNSPGEGSIFQYFKSRLSPSSIWNVKFLRVECLDLLTCLDEFDEWRQKVHQLRVVK